MLTDKAMEAKDLMIGNYVNCKWDEEVWSDENDEWIDIEKEAIGRVVFLDSTGFSEYDIMVEGESNREHFDAIEPIPLTEEWLLKFGFEDTGVALIMQTGNGGSIDWDGMSFYVNMIRHDSLKFVHQLQNLYFALTGKELTLKP